MNVRELAEKLSKLSPDAEITNSEGSKLVLIEEDKNKCVLVMRMQFKSDLANQKEVEEDIDALDLSEPKEKNWPSKLIELAESEGFEGVMEMLEAAVVDSVVPAICCNEDCDYTTGMEPDQDRGWCEDCETNTVKSCLVLAGII